MKDYIPVVFNDQNEDINKRFERLHREFRAKVTVHLKKMETAFPQKDKSTDQSWEFEYSKILNNLHCSVISKLPDEFRFCFNSSTINKNDLVQLLARANIAITDPTDTENNKQLLLLVDDIQNKYNEFLLKGCLGPLLILGTIITTIALITVTAPAFPMVLIIGVCAFIVNAAYQGVKGDDKEEFNKLKNNIKSTKTDTNNFFFFKIKDDLKDEKSESQIKQQTEYLPLFLF